MQVSATTILKSKRRPAAGLPKVGDSVAFAGSVLRVLTGDARSLLILVEANSQKLTIRSADIPGGYKLKGGEAVSLRGTVTRVGESLVAEFTPISVAVDGWTATRVTMAAKSVKRAR